MSWLSDKDKAWLGANLAPKISTLEQWKYAGAYFRSFGAPESRVLEAAYNAIKPGQSFCIEMTTEVAYAAETGGDTAKRVYHGTSLANACLIIKNGFIGCALMEVLFVIFSLAIFLAFSSFYSFCLITKHNTPDLV